MLELYKKMRPMFIVKFVPGNLKQETDCYAILGMSMERVGAVFVYSVKVPFISSKTISSKYLLTKDDYQEIANEWTQSVNNDVNPATNQASQEVVELTCRKCPFECESKDEIDNHMQTKHKQRGAKKSELRFKCHLCDYGANDTRKIDAHCLTFHGILTCEKCEYRAKNTWKFTLVAVFYPVEFVDLK